MDEAKELKISHDISNKCDNLIFTKTNYCKLGYTCGKNQRYYIATLEQHVDIIFTVSPFLLIAHL